MPEQSASMNKNGQMNLRPVSDTSGWETAWNAAERPVPHNAVINIDSVPYLDLDAALR